MRLTSWVRTAAVATFLFSVPAAAKIRHVTAAGTDSTAPALTAEELDKAHTAMLKAADEDHGGGGPMDPEQCRAQCARYMHTGGKACDDMCKGDKGLRVGVDAHQEKVEASEAAATGQPVVHVIKGKKHRR